jgi:oxalate decarboxylase/phosphoglucose isomerase-like protein (cupin superfamily)
VSESTPPPRRVQKPWGHELIWAETPRVAGKLLHIRAGCRLSLQFHRQKDEALLLQAGEMMMSLDDERGELRTWKMRPGDAVHVRPGQRHRMTALSDCDLVEVSTTELDDVVRIEDDYGRAGGGAPGR